MTRVRVAVLGPGGVGGLLAAALTRAGTDTVVVAPEATAAAVARDGLRVESVRLGAFTARPAAVARLEAEVDVLLVATKATALDAALGRIAAAPALVVPLLNGVEHVARLRARFGADRVAAGAIRVQAERTAPGVVVQTSPFLRVDVAPATPAVERLVHLLRAAEVPAAAHASEADVLWSKLVRLVAIALTTTAYAAPLGAIRSHPRRRLALAGVVDEAAAVAQAEGAAVAADAVLAELAGMPAAATSSLARDVAAGRPAELDAIAGAVLRAAARHDLPCPAITELAGRVEARVAARAA